jgi:hypothetical protein
MIRNFSRWISCYILTGIFSFLIAFPADAFWSVQGDECSIDIGGSIRSIGVGIRNYDNSVLFGRNNDYDGLSQSLLRITSTGTLPHDASFEIHLLGEVFFTSTNQGSPLTGSVYSQSFPKRYRITRGSWNLAEDDDFYTSLDTDRLNIKYTFSDLDITLGRQAINFSQAYFWNPLDVFMAFDPQAFDRDYKPGVDAVRVDYTLGNFSYLTFVSAIGRELKLDYSPATAQVSAGPVTSYGSAFVARYGTTVNDWDLSVQAGKVYGGYQTGAGFAGEIHEIGLRGEAAYFVSRGSSTTLYPDADATGYISETDLVEDNFILVVGADYRFESSLYFNLEYLYNSQGENDNFNEAFLKSAVAESISLGRHLTGLQVSYEFHPLLNAQTVWIYSFSDNSSLVSPTLTYSIADEAEFLAGGILGFGKRPVTRQIFPDTFFARDIVELESEFGTYPNFFFMEFKFYF